MTSHANATEPGEKSFPARLRLVRDYLERRHVLLIVYGLVLATFPLLTTFWHRNLFYLTFLPVFLLTIDAGFVRQTARNWGFRLACAFIAGIIRAPLGRGRRWGGAAARRGRSGLKEKPLLA